jgi:hypothetical protein
MDRGDGGPFIAAERGQRGWNQWRAVAEVIQSP